MKAIFSRDFNFVLNFQLRAGLEGSPLRDLRREGR